MPWFISRTIGDGSNAEGKALRPAIALYEPPSGWSATAHIAGLMLVRCEHLPAFDADARIRPLRRAALADIGALDDGETDDWEAPDLALKVVRRIVLSQLLGADDFGVKLSLRLGDIPAATRQRIAARLAAYKSGIDISSLTANDLVGDALALVLPQIRARVLPGQPSSRGTFTDDFSNAPATETDIALVTPSGGTAWTRTVGAVDGCRTRATFRAAIHISSGRVYLCDDQGSDEQYVQFAPINTNFASFILNRATDDENYIGVRVNGGKIQIYRQTSGAFAQLGSTGSTTVTGGAADAPADVVRLESDGDDAHEAFLDSGSGFVSQVGPVNYAVHAGITRQGLHTRDSGGFGWFDNFEAGLLGGSGGTVYENSLTSALSAGYTLAGQHTAEAALTSAITAGYTPASQHTMQAAVTYAAATAAAFVSALVETGTVYENSLTFGLTAGATLGSQLTAAASLLSALNAGSTVASGIVAQASIATGISVGETVSALGVLAASHTAGISAGFTSAGAIPGTINESITFGLSLQAAFVATDLWTVLDAASGTWNALPENAGTWTDLVRPDADWTEH